MSDTLRDWQNAQKVWRDGFAPQMSPDALRALRDALETNDPRLVRHATTRPGSLRCYHGEPVACACPVAFCGWRGAGLESVAEVEEFFAEACGEADRRLGEPVACRWFLNWWDDTPPQESRPLLLAEVKLALAGREGVPHAA